MKIRGGTKKMATYSKSISQFFLFLVLSWGSLFLVIHI
jgi:hypothetical protein